MASNVYLQQRFAALVWYCLDNELVRSATFYAERFFFVDTDHHDARHLLATAYLRAGQTHSALHLVNTPGDTACPGCNELKAKCCTVLGRFAAAREAYELARAGAGELVECPNRAWLADPPRQDPAAPVRARRRASPTRPSSISRLARLR